jgi:hypothetical protein
LAASGNGDGVQEFRISQETSEPPVPPTDIIKDGKAGNSQKIPEPPAHFTDS